MEHRREARFLPVLLYILLFEAVLEGDGAVEDQMAGLSVAVIKAEVALTHELQAGGVLTLFGHGHFGEAVLDLAAGEDVQAVGIEIVEEVLIRAVGVGISLKRLP